MWATAGGIRGDGGQGWICTAFASSVLHRPLVDRNQCRAIGRVNATLKFARACNAQQGQRCRRREVQTRQQTRAREIVGSNPCLCSNLSVSDLMAYNHQASCAYKWRKFQHFNYFDARRDCNLSSEGEVCQFEAYSQPTVTQLHPIPCPAVDPFRQSRPFQMTRAFAARLFSWQVHRQQSSFSVAFFKGKECSQQW